MPPSIAARAHRFTRGTTRVAKACKAIIRYAHEQALQPGDRLPPQERLRPLLGFSNDTLLAAMKILVARGALLRRSGWGTEIRDLDSLGGINWTVGLAGLVAPDSGPIAFYGALLHRLLSRLSRINCRCNTYFRGDHPHWPQRPADFPGLAEDLEDEALDGLILLTSLDPARCRAIERRGIVVHHVGFWDTMPHATIVDRVVLVVDAAAALMARGARRLALLDPDASDLLAAACKRAVTSDPPVKSMLAACEVIVTAPGGVEATAVARQLREHAVTRRPDALIVPDDIAAQTIAADLASNGAYRPLVATGTNRQLPLSFALPVIRIEIDLDELADRAIARFRRRLLNPAENGGIDYVRPYLMDTGGGSR